MNKLKAINFLDEMSEDLKSFLESIEVEIVDEKDHVLSEPFLFIGEKFENLSDSIFFADREANTYVITMERHLGDWSEIIDLKIILLHYEMILSQTGGVLATRLFTNENSIQLEKSFGEIINDMKSFKVSNPLYTGHYSDIAFDYAFEKKKSYLQVRNYLNSLMTFLTYLQQGDYIEIPFDVDIGVTDEGLVLQVIAPIKQLGYDVLKKGLSKQFKNEPYGNLLLNCIEIADYFDIFSLKNSKKVIFTAVWIDAFSSRNFSYKVYDSLEHKIYGADIISSKVVLNYDFNSETDGIYLPGRFMADKTRGRWFRIVKAQEIKKTLDELKASELEFEEHKPFKEYLIEKFDTKFSKDEILFLHRAHLSTELQSMFAESVFKSKMDIKQLENEIQRIMESLLSVDGVWPDNETKQEVYSEEVISGVTSKINLVFKKNDDPEKIKRMIMGIFIKEAKLDMRVANKLAEIFVSNGFDLFAIENFKQAFKDESGHTLIDSDEVAELKERFAEVEHTMSDVNSLNNDFAKESQNEDLIARNKQLSKEVEDLQNKLQSKHGDFLHQARANNGTSESQLKVKIKSLEGQVREANKKIEQLAKKASSGPGFLSAGSGNKVPGKENATAVRDSENLISKNILEAEKSNFAQEKKRLEARLNTADLKARAEKQKLQQEINRLNKERKINKEQDNSLQLKKDLLNAQAETKANSLKLKKLESHNKMLEQQLEKMMGVNRKGQVGNQVKEKANPRRDRKIKQLETLYQKSQKIAEKSLRDLLEKKSIIAKQKNEIQLLKNKLKEAQERAA